MKNNIGEVRAELVRRILLRQSENMDGSLAAYEALVAGVPGGSAVRAAMVAGYRDGVNASRASLIIALGRTLTLPCRA